MLTNKKPSKGYWIKLKIKDEIDTFVKTHYATNILQAVAEAFERLRQRGLDPENVVSVTSVVHPNHRWPKRVIE